MQSPFRRVCKRGLDNKNKPAASRLPEKADYARTCGNVESAKSALTASYALRDTETRGTREFRANKFRLAAGCSNKTCVPLPQIASYAIRGMSSRFPCWYAKDFLERRIPAACRWSFDDIRGHGDDFCTYLSRKKKKTSIPRTITPER